ncbi:MAG: hypothetical protein ACOH14_06355 [Rhodoglobus sp.]
MSVDTTELTPRMKQLRARKHLEQAPTLIGHILTLVMPAGGSGGDKVSGTRDPQMPLNAQALEDANDLYAQLVNFAVSHARALGVNPPGSTLGWSRRDQDCDGLPSWATAGDAAALTNDVTQWLIAGGDRIAKLKAAGNYFDDVRNLITPLYGRYPQAERVPAFASRECLVCGRRTVIVNFADDSDSVSVACAFCGWAVPDAGIERYIEEAK